MSTESKDKKLGNMPLESKNQKILSDKLYRWIAIKALDGDKKILNAIKENFKINC